MGTDQSGFLVGTALQRHRDKPLAGYHNEFFSQSPEWGRERHRCPFPAMKARISDDAFRAYVCRQPTNSRQRPSAPRARGVAMSESSSAEAGEALDRCRRRGGGEWAPDGSGSAQAVSLPGPHSIRPPEPIMCASDQARSRSDTGRVAAPNPRRGGEGARVVRCRGGVVGAAPRRRARGSTSGPGRTRPSPGGRRPSRMSQNGSARGRRGRCPPRLL